MRELRIRIQDKVVARIIGEELEQRARVHWFRFSALDISPDFGTTFLRFHAEAETGEDAPNDAGEEKDDRRRSNLTFEAATTSTSPDDWELSVVRPSFVCRFFWRNPLTPASRGVWMRLQFRRENNVLLLTQRDAKSDPRVWSFSADKEDWRSVPILPSFGAWRAADIAQNLPQVAYVPKDGTGCALLTRAHNRTWIVDPSSMDNLHDGYHVRFLDADTNGIRPLAARFEAANGSFPVNAGALRSELRGVVATEAGSVDLTCARTETDPPRFVVEWDHQRANPQPAVEQLSLNTLYNLVARHYTLGMAAARSRNRLSFAPTRLDAPRMRLQFDLDADGTLLRQVLVDDGTSVEWVTGAASETDGDPIVLRFTQELEPDVRPPALRQILAPGAVRPKELLLLSGPGAAGVHGGWVVNGVVMKIDTDESFGSAALKIGLAPDEERYGQAPATVDVRLDFTKATIAPVSDDPEIGFEALSSWLERERPIVIDLRKENPVVGLTIREFANDEQSRLLRIGVRNPETVPKSYEVDAVVLDPSPLTAARVRSLTTVDPEGLLAEYSDDSDQAPEWAFASTEGEMDVVLPPQVIGEEMVKGVLHVRGKRVPFTDKPFDFRLSPSASLVLDRTDINTARTVAPWSLRRLLGQRPGVVGAKLQRAQFELLYGLLTKIEEIPALRIAELDALVGRVPFPDEFLDFLRAARARRESKPRELLRADYCQRIAEFIHGMLYRPSWWPVFRDFTARQQLTITGKGVSSSLRKNRATANPFEIAQFHDLLTRDDARDPLRGGVDWAFQSRNVYDELTSKPDSSSVTLEGLAFGSLGGWGKQTAEFNNGKTLIISETTQGRLDSVTVIRIGRIAMLWNRARHVIVYERTTRRAPRYAANEPDDLSLDTWEFQTGEFEGLAALRKVREYVQITEQKRTYPDTSTSRPVAGPLKASFFETTVIPVKSSWGHDVPNGFVIALRGPLTDAEKDFFPFPKIFLKKARARGKGEGTVDQQLKDPSELLFFTSTRPEDGGDTDLWPAVPDIDFPLVRTNGALLPFQSRFTRLRKQPDARPADFGQSRFTITVDPAEEAVDLMHGRLSEGIEARVSSVSLARGRMPADVPLPVNSLTTKLAAPLAETHAQLHDGLSELRMQIAAARNDGAAVLGDMPQFAEEARTLTRELAAKAEHLGTALPAGIPAFDWTGEQRQWNERLAANAARQVESWRSQLQLPPASAADSKRHAKSALESVCRQVQQRIDDVGFLPIAAMNRIDIAQAALIKRARMLGDELLAGFHASVDRLAARFAELVAASSAEEQEPSAAAGLPALQADVDAVLAAFSETLTRVDVDAIKHLTDTLGPWFSTDGLLQKLAAAIRELTADLLLLASELIATVPPLTIGEPDWESLKNGTRTLLDEFLLAIDAALTEQTKELRDKLKGVLDANGKLDILSSAGDRLETLCREGMKLIDADQIAKGIADFLAGAENELTELSRIDGALQKKWEELEATVWGTVPGSFDDAAKFADEAKQGFTDLLGGLRDDLSLADVEKAVEAASRNIIEALDGTARQVEQAMVGELRKLAEPVEAAATTAALELTRILATGPVNDAIACTRDRLGYYYDAAKDLLDVTHAAAIFNDLGQSVLNSLSAELPFDRIRDRLLPQLEGLDLSQLLPNFGGLKLEHLFPDLAAPNDGSDNDWIRIRHGFDKDRLTAFADVDVDKVIEGTPTVFILPPVSLKLQSPHFLASSRLELSAGGGKAQSTKASIQADWQLCLSDRPIVTLREATLRYESDGGFDFDFDSENVELAPEFQFITQALKSLLPQEEGLTLTPIMPAGIRAELGLPLPDLTTGAFTLTGLTLYAYMELLIADGFEIRTGFWLSKPERPFGLAVVFLGGGGWVGFEVAYRPPDRFVTRVSIGISAGAFVAVNFGVAHGSAGILFTAGVDFFRDFQTQGGRTLITLGVLVWGEFSILGIASASLRLMLSVTYDADKGSMIGQGTVEVSIKICWCFTLRVRQSVQQQFVGGNRRSGGAQASLAASSRDFKKAIQAVNSNVAL
jgi:hypothetical protein